MSELITRAESRLAAALSNQDAAKTRVAKARENLRNAKAKQRELDRKAKAAAKKKPAKKKSKK